MIVVGIDVGIRGGLAAVRAAADDGVGTLLSAIDIPTVGDGARERVDVAAVRDWLTTFKPALVLIERAQAMPRQGASSGFKYGRSVGALEAAVVLSAIPLEIVEPASWKRYWHLPGKDKERARAAESARTIPGRAWRARPQEGSRKSGVRAPCALRNSHVTADASADRRGGSAASVRSATHFSAFRKGEQESEQT